MGKFCNPSSRQPAAWCLIVLCSLALPPVALNAAQFFNDWAATNLNTVPLQNGPLDDPDHDGAPNLAEFAFGTDPLAGNGLGAALFPSFTGANGFFGVELLELGGHAAGVQIDVDASADLNTWIRPWWFRTVTNSLPSDPPGSIREALTTYLPGTNVFFARAAITLLEAGPETATYYVATNGSDSATGTSIATPFASLRKAVGVANPGNLIYVRGGTYVVTQTVAMSRSGTAALTIRVQAYPGEHPFFDFSGETTGNGLNPSGNFWQIDGLEISNAASHGILVTGVSNLVERCVTHDCRDTGTEIYTPGSYNLILNCDSYRNYDAPTHGENADGFTAKFGVGPGNVFSGCRSWENADDGWDLWEATNSVIISNCWSFGNGSNFWNDTAFAGDGNGFKLGGDYFPGPHRVMNCVSFNNHQAGFDQNNNTAGLTVNQNTAWNNAAKNFNLNHTTNTATTIHIVCNNLSIGGHSSDTFFPGSILSNNSWQVVSPVASTNDLLSVDSSLARAPRRDDGSLPEVPFLRPVPGGRLIDKGVVIGLPFYGSAPDLGAFESPAWDGLH